MKHLHEGFRPDGRWKVALGKADAPRVVVDALHLVEGSRIVRQEWFHLCPRHTIDRKPGYKKSPTDRSKTCMIIYNICSMRAKEGNHLFPDCVEDLLQRVDAPASGLRVHTI